MKRISFYVQLFLSVFGMLLFGCSQTQSGILFPSSKGSVQVKVSGLPQRTVQATLSEVDHITIGLETAKNATSQTLTKAALYNGNASASVVFPDLWPGGATVSATVYNAASASIGTATATASVIANQVTALNLNLKLSPTDILAGNLAIVGTILPGAASTPIPTPTYPTLNIFTEFNDIITSDGVTFDGGAPCPPACEVYKIYNPATSVIRIVNNTDHNLDLELYIGFEDTSSIDRRVLILAGHTLDYDASFHDGKNVRALTLSTYNYYYNYYWVDLSIFITASNTLDYNALSAQGKKAKAVTAWNYHYPQLEPLLGNNFIDFIPQC